MTEPLSDTPKIKVMPTTAAVILLALGGGNVYQGRESVQETKQLRAEIRDMRTEVQGMATTVTLLNWRVSNLEGVRDNGQGT